MLPHDRSMRVGRAATWLASRTVFGGLSVDLLESRTKETLAALDGVRATGGRLKVHQPPVQILVMRVEVARALKHLDGIVGVGQRLGVPREASMAPHWMRWRCGSVHE